MWRVLGLCSDPAVTDVASFTTELSEPLLHLGEVGVGSILDPKERTQVKPRCASQRLNCVLQQRALVAATDRDRPPAGGALGASHHALHADPAQGWRAAPGRLSLD